ncbi:hypothetical protein EVAR_8940_1 [Eumeta japonica]|uniref:Uncharacterized protein n=1 Tax=Eumeta variegata TaxID=151549 RepID=A0A4C1U0L2_EUMVA|nr:hypothetical protein EVAR_8940_1 [Eumeta japonica]
MFLCKYEEFRPEITTNTKRYGTITATRMRLIETCVARAQLGSGHLLFRALCARAPTPPQYRRAPLLRFNNINLLLMNAAQYRFCSSLYKVNISKRNDKKFRSSPEMRQVQR